MRRVYVDMVGDLFHQGHVEILKSARAMGDFLIVGVLSDSAVASYKRLPVMTLSERVAVIEACRYVDRVIADVPLIVTSEFLETHDIAYVVHDKDISSKTIQEAYGAPYREGKLKLVDRTEGISTTDLIERILSGKHNQHDI